MTNRSGARRRRGRAVAVAGTVALAAGAATVAAVGFGGDGTDMPTVADLPPATAQVTRQTMLDTDEVSGDLGYGVTTTLAGRIAGVVTKMPQAGDLIRRGRPIYRVDNRPVVLMYGAVAAYRTLGSGVVGTDVRQLEANLKALGYGGFTVDKTYTWSTATAVKQWQKDLGLPQTGQVEQGRVLFAPGVIRIDTVTAGVNQSTGGGAEVLQYTGISREVTARLEVSKQRLARKGVKVQVQMPDGTKVAGRVERVYSVVEQPVDAGSDPETWIETVVSLTDPRAAAGIEAAVVNVVFTASERKDVLTVPVAALVALAEGGYGLEVVEGSTTHYIKVQTGLFANGRVEVTGGGLTEGMTVGMPR
ncbi:peptidoglycan-binding protein [Planotetraspora thailandica]|uniref:Peptidoglycan-binding protein n=1 Tax=Planotetraspora thailandica TaxID=487172 RepID=A0A8J4DF76_9ACTN|nr:peptidoglycan-binding protein [Planotetraspora thailandica]GII59311.1 peptidoglycan-binding protein [Planotetraspora thailandica]